MDWRHRGIADPVRAAELLSEQLMTMYVEFFDAYAVAMSHTAKPELAVALRSRQDRVLLGGR